MRRAAAVALAVVAGACSSNDAEPSPSPTSRAAGSDVVLHAFNVHLDPGAEPGAEEIAFVVHASDFPLRVAVTGAEVDICPVPPPEGDTPPCEHGSEAEISAEGVIVRATDGSVDIDEITISYLAADRTARLELPTIAPRPGESVCKDACNPVFELTPFRAGRFTATATWEGIGSGRLLMESGAVAERAYSGQGRPYEVIASNEASSDQGEAELTIKATLPEGETALALENGGARPLLEPAIDVTWP